MLTEMGSKKEKVRGIRFEQELWEVIVREAQLAQRTPAGQVRYLLEKELTREGLLAAEGSAHYRTRDGTDQKKKG